MNTNALFIACAVALLSLLLSSCGGQAGKEQKIELEAAKAVVPKESLSEAMKATLAGIVKNLKVIDFTTKIKEGKLKITGNTSQAVLPISVSDDLVLRDSKIRAMGMYCADVVFLRLHNKPTTEQGGIVSRLAVELGMTDVMEILAKRRDNTLRLQTMSEEEMNQQKADLLLEMMARDNLPELVLWLSGVTGEMACLVVTTNFEVNEEWNQSVAESYRNQLNNLAKIIELTSAHYPELKATQTMLNELSALMPDVKTARQNKEQILAIRTQMLK